MLVIYIIIAVVSVAVVLSVIAEFFFAVLALLVFIAAAVFSTVKAISMYQQDKDKKTHGDVVDIGDIGGEEH